MIINNYFHENNSATMASLIKEKMLRAVVDSALGKLTFYGAVLCFLRSESLFSTLQYFIKNILIHCYSDYTTEWHTG